MVYVRRRKDLPPPNHGPECECFIACYPSCTCMAGRFSIRRRFEVMVMLEANAPLLLDLVRLEALFAEPASSFAQDEELVHRLQTQHRNRGWLPPPV